MPLPPQPNSVRIEFGPRKKYSLELGLEALCDLGACSYGVSKTQVYTLAWIEEQLHVLTHKRRGQTTAVLYRNKEGQALRRVLVAGEPTYLAWEAVAA